ncbi:glycosyltransferase family 2 protein [Lewinella sp. LCG006]|uniref:glycosyltransferase family 2 protein n=1 Tax=Lewinella sp. LCG006 TaxID=3231911 RepID=UPI00345F3269
MTARTFPIHLMLPAYNEGKVIAEVIREIKMIIECPIIVIDDGSTDDTALCARQAGARVISHPINRGAGAACMTGISLARQEGYTCLVFMDADGQHDPKDVDTLVNAQQEQNLDLVIGSRFMQKNEGIPLLRRFFNLLANLLTNSFSTHRYSDTQSGFRLLNQNAIDRLELVQDDFSYCSEMIIQAERAKIRVGECPISVRYTDYSIRKGQDFQVGLFTAFHFLWKLIFK